MTVQGTLGAWGHDQLSSYSLVSKTKRISCAIWHIRDLQISGFRFVILHHNSDSGLEDCDTVQHAVQVSMPMLNKQREFRYAVCSAEQNTPNPGNRISCSNPI